MPHLCLRIAFLCSVIAQSLSAIAVEPVKHVGIYVQPYYEAAQTKDGRPHVAVGKQFDDLLSSNRREDIAIAQEMIQSQPALVTPMTMMVLAIRLYDVGLRDDAVFWFYAAKDRYGTLAEVLDMRSSALSQVEQATRDFAVLAGPVINGYAFCNLKNQRELRSKALAWVEKHPYQAIFMQRLPARPGDRATNLRLALDKLRAGAKQEGAYLGQADNVAKLKANRKENGADEKYCW
jgi:hypothetical protein